MKRFQQYKSYAIFFCLTAFAALVFPGSSQAAGRVVVDMAGREVEAPDEATRIACMQGSSYETVFALGAKDRIVLVRSDHKSAYPLAIKTNPDIKKIRSLDGVSPKSPVNIEEFIKINPDLVIYWNIPQELQKFKTAGIPAIVLNWSAKTPRNMEEAVDDQKRKLSFLSSLLGAAAQERYRKWEAYLDKNVALIKSRLKEVPASFRPTVYVGNSWGSNILSTWGGDSAHQYVIELCGGKFIGVTGPGRFPEITPEQMLSWAPEVLIVDNHGRFPEKVIKGLKTKPEWASIPAVKNDRIYRIPSGVFFLDKGTSASVFMLWLAKKLHPDQFRDINIVDHLKYYFKTFYDYNLTDEEAGRVLSGYIDSSAYNKD